MNNLLLDIGGTFIKCSDGRMIPVDSGGSREKIVEALKEAVGDCSLLDFVGVAIPGPFNYNEGVFLMKHKYAAVYGENFRTLVDIPERVQLKFIHDVNCLLSCELVSGNGQGFENVALVAIGTGLGFAMAKKGKILEDENGSPLVKIWNRSYMDGILEDYASKRGFAKVYGQIAGRPLPDGVSVRDMADGAIDNKVYADCFAEVGRTIARAIAPILQEYKIECLLFGGQISKSFRLMKDAVSDELATIDSLKCISEVANFDVSQTDVEFLKEKQM